MPGSRLGPTLADANRGSSDDLPFKRGFGSNLGPKTQPGEGPTVVLPSPVVIKPLVLPKDRWREEQEAMRQRAREYVLYILLTTGYLPKFELLMRADPKFAAAVRAESQRIAAKAALELEERRAAERRIMEKLQAEREARRKRLLKTLGGILKLAAERAGMSLSQLEVYVGTPDFVINTGSEAGLSDAQLVLETSYPDLTISQIRDLTLERFVDLILRCNLLSNSCGATSAILDAVTSTDGTMGPMTPTTVEGLINALELAAKTNRTYWCCRITREPHSFFIEYRSGEVRVYQSYFSKYTLAFSVKQGRKFSFRNFISLLQTTMTEDDRSRKLELFMAEPHWRNTQITYRLNLSPARPETIIQNILALLATASPQWADVRHRTMRELAPDAPPIQQATVTDFSSQLPTEYTLAADEAPYLMELTEEQERTLDETGRLPDGDYTSLLASGVQYTLQRYDEKSNTYTFRKKN
ncbi:hypothetical protein [Hyalangium rubrum]|uniref:Uncharacterized protein n=1 Tax=Hyalangium rubrum TaxID=3103134 RepID=A0ABU5GYM8_9BACT|nr:hypothetical protein [Hyalangium sp. s54d21]MDY7225613.1 hypothetical protein [Hyalangium sp. s54d21]